jgi:ribonuclease D
MESVYVQDRDGLHDLCQKLQGSSWVALDTEFVRTRTYYARLCLIQVATPDLVACVDPLALDVGALLDLIYAPNRLKVFHAARQDLEVFYDARGTAPQPLFDTQVAAALLGYDDQIGYGALVQEVADVKLEKQHTRTDWCVRPLTPEQLQYARDDVVYLCELYLTLHQRLSALGRSEWVTEECAALADPTNYRNDPDEAYRRMRQGHLLPPTSQSVLKELAAWRERTAQARDLPRNWIATDRLLFHIARTLPEDAKQLAATEGITPVVVRKWDRALLAVVQQAREAPRSALWEPPVRLGRQQQAVYDRVRQRIEEVAKDNGINPARIGGRKAIQALLLQDDGGPLLRGWRQLLLGEEMQRLRDQALCTA